MPLGQRIAHMPPERRRSIDDRSLGAHRSLGLTSGTPSSASNAFCRRTPASCSAVAAATLVLEPLVPLHPLQVPE
jgi:hypothetical protein